MGNRNLSQLFSFDTKYFRLRYKGALPSYRFRLDFHLTVKFPIISFIHQMQSSNNLQSAISYYTAMNNKDFDKISSCLHPQVTCISPLDTINTRDVVISAAQNFANFF
jgi:hypothetical protein